MAELRERAKRFALSSPCATAESPKLNGISGQAQNISGNGILFAADRELAVGTQIELQRRPGLIVRVTAI